MEIVVFIGEKQISMPEDANFIALKKRLLYSEGILSKYFSFNGEKINENLMISHYPSFDIFADHNLFREYKKGKFRCSSCRKYFKASNWTCSHTPRCKAKVSFNKGYYKKICGKYEEKSDETIIDNIFKKIDEKNKKTNENKRKNWLTRINEILGFK